MRIVLCNCPPAEAGPLAKQLVQERLAACVNIVPGVRSVYIWEGKMEDDQESTLLIKVTADKVQALKERIIALHSYDTVEVISLPVILEESNPDYITWVQSMCGASEYI